MIDEVSTASLPRKSPFRRLWLLGALVYAVFLWWVGWTRLAPVLASIDPRTLAAMAAAMAGSMAVRVVKWRLVLGPGSAAAPLYFLAKAGGDWSPARIGELAPLMLPRFRNARFGAWIITDRLLEMAATLGLGALGIVAFGLTKGMPTLGRIPEARMYNMLGYVGLALVVLVAGPAIILTRRAMFERLAESTKISPRFRRLAAPMAAAARVSSETRAFGARLPMASALTVLATSLDIVVGILLYRSFGFTVPFMLLAVVQCAHALASALPFTPNATGVPYVVAAALLNQAAGLPVDVLTAAVGVSIAVTNIVFWTAFVIAVRALKTGAATPQAELFDHLASGDALYRYDETSLARLNQLEPHKGRLLDIGCGDGAIAAALDARRVVALDISQRCALLARRRGADAVIADARAALPFASGSFDTVYCVDVIHHLPRADWEALVKEARRVLAPRGRLVIVEPDACYAFVRWTQAPRSPIRVAPCSDEPAIYPDAIESLIAANGFTSDRRPIRIEGSQVCRNTFPLWQRLVKAPFVIALAAWHGARPNKFAIIARKGPMGQSEEA